MNWQKTEMMDAVAGLARQILTDDPTNFDALVEAQLLEHYELLLTGQRRPVLTVARLLHVSGILVFLVTQTDDAARIRELVAILAEQAHVVDCTCAQMLHWRTRSASTSTACHARHRVLEGATVRLAV